MVNSEILTTRSAAELLDYHVEHVRRLARDGRIPCVKIGGQWRFVHSDLIDWIRRGAPQPPKRLDI